MELKPGKYLHFKGMRDKRCANVKTAVEINGVQTVGYHVLELHLFKHIHPPRRFFPHLQQKPLERGALTFT